MTEDPGFLVFFFSGLRKHKYASFYDRNLNFSGRNGMNSRGVRVKAVLFDLGGTLIRTAEIPRILRKILEAKGIKRSLKEISLAHKEMEKQFSLQDYAGPYEEFWIRWNLYILDKLGIRKNARSLAKTIDEEWWDYSDVRLYPDAEETLKQLKSRGLKIGIVTNGFQRDIDEILQKAGLTNFFDVTVGIDATGKAKPNKEIFLYALRKLGVSPQKALFVGDQIETDYNGAREAGLMVLLIDREDKIRKRVKKIRSLREIATLLDNNLS